MMQIGVFMTGCVQRVPLSLAPGSMQATVAGDVTYTSRDTHSLGAFVLHLIKGLVIFHLSLLII